jgi:hypothetical protein
VQRQAGWPANVRSIMRFTIKGEHTGPKHGTSFDLACFAVRY